MAINSLILVRHGESQGNVDRNIYKSIPDYALRLTPNGITQAKKAGEIIRDYFDENPCFTFYYSTF